MNRKHFTSLVVFVCLAAGGALAFYQLRFPLRMGNDGAFYVQGAHSILRGEGYLKYTDDGQQPQIDWPPIYSLAMAGVIYATSLDLAPGLKLLNGASTVLFLALWLVLLKRHLASRWLFALGALLTVLDWGIWYFNGLVSSEPLSLVVFALAMLAGFEALKEGLPSRRVRWLLLTGLALALLALTRYACVAFVAGSGLVFLFEGRSRPALQRIRELAAYSAAPALLLGGWFLYCKLATGSYTFLEEYPATPTHYDFAGFLFYTSRWVINALGVPLRFSPAAFLYLIPVVLLCAAAFRKSRDPLLAKRTGFLIGNIVLYLGLLYYMYFQHDSFTKRYIFFLVPLFELTFLLVADALVTRKLAFGRLGRRCAAGALALFLAAFVVSSPRRTLERIRMSQARTSDTIEGLNVVWFHVSLELLPLMERELGEDDVVISNFARYVSAFLDRPCLSIRSIEDLSVILRDARYDGKEIYLLLSKTRRFDESEYPMIDWQDFVRDLAYETVHDEPNARLMRLSP